jgi:putative DNA primase/helicase
MNAPFIVPDFQSIVKNLPHLVERDRWLAWNLETVGGRLTKPPRGAKTGATIDVSDSTQLVSFEEAREAYECGRFSGVGYSLCEGDLALDLDNCRDPETGTIDPWALEIFERAQSYCELTPSGTGHQLLGSGSGRRLTGK